ncbi:Aryl sulfotransferase [Zostera marina]|uniref:Sulfotransferase n=1 Tax=Zostera marina TaxID=29655 RepID=A0A0K9Q514_ZOSMR|nr:Aryl sulfotransferase [Zostera marina]
MIGIHTGDQMAGILPVERCFAPKKQEETEEDSQMYKSYAEIVSSLPFVDSWGTKLVLYNGLWAIDELLPGIIAFRDHFKARETDIIVATFPKAGTTWTKALAFTILTREVNHPSSPTHPLLGFNPHSCVTTLEYLYMGRENLMPDTDVLNESPRLFATHVPYSFLPKSIVESGAKIINVSRERKSTFVSQWKFYGDIWEDGDSDSLDLEKYVDLFTSGISLYGPDWVYRAEYTNASSTNSNLLLLSYEEMIEKPVENAKKMAEFMGCGFTDDEVKLGIVDEIVKLCSFDNLKSQQVNKNGRSFSMIDNKHFFRKGQAGDWVNHLSPEMVSKLEKVAGKDNGQ